MAYQDNRDFRTKTICDALRKFKQIAYPQMEYFIPPHRINGTFDCSSICGSLIARDFITKTEQGVYTLSAYYSKANNGVSHVDTELIDSLWVAIDLLEPYENRYEYLMNATCGNNYSVGLYNGTQYFIGEITENSSHDCVFRLNDMCDAGEPMDDIMYIFIIKDKNLMHYFDTVKPKFPCRIAFLEGDSIKERPTITYFEIR